MKKVVVDLGDRSYPILISPNLLDDVALDAYFSGNQVLIVTNETIAPLYLEKVLARIPTSVDTLVLPDGEEYKNLDSLSLIFDHLIANKHNRTTTLVALGGGVIGDITGFAAACYQRGVGFIQIPTTLLAQVDSSVGGKTAVNHPGGKNMIGAFFQPRAVIVDINTLATLPDREFRSGLAEVIKYGLIIDRPFFEWLESNIQKLLARDVEALEYAIEQSCINKARVVSADETEQGLRAMLNLGHTFGHAIETFQNYTGWLHGEAVSAGMVMAAELSYRMGKIGEGDFARIQAILQTCELPVTAPQGMTEDAFLNLMAMDKKVANGALKLVLLEAIGQAIVTAGYDQAALLETLRHHTLS